LDHHGRLLQDFPPRDLTVESLGLLTSQGFPLFDRNRLLVTVRRVVGSKSLTGFRRFRGVDQGTRRRDRLVVAVGLGHLRTLVGVVCVTHAVGTGEVC